MKTFGAYKREPSRDDDPLDAFVAPFHTGSKVIGKEGFYLNRDYFSPKFVEDELTADEPDIVEPIVDEPVVAMTPLRKFLKNLFKR